MNATQAKENTIWNNLPSTIKQTITKAVESGRYDCTISNMKCTKEQGLEIFEHTYGDIIAYIPWHIKKQILTDLSFLGYKVSTQTKFSTNFIEKILHISWA